MEGFEEVESFQTTKTMPRPGSTQMACDGAYSPNSGKGGWGFFDSKEYKSGTIPAPTTNNIAEYTGLIKLLEHILSTNRHKEDITITMDSQLVVRHMDGSYRVKEPRLIPLHARATGLLSATNAVIIWASRESPIMKLVDTYAKGGTK